MHRLLPVGTPDQPRRSPPSSRAPDGGPRREPPRERILDAAADLFYREGVRAVGVDAIIATAGVAKASFYRHFRSKEDLVVEWLRSDRPRWLDRVRTETEQRASRPDERLLVFFDVVSEHVASAGYAGCPYLSTAVELREPSGPLRAVIADFLIEVETYLGSLAAAAGLRAPEQLGTELRLLCGGFMTAAAVVGSSDGQSEAVRAAVHALVDAAR
jgi:AcrR family transcriptional regulator